MNYSNSIRSLFFYSFILSSLLILGLGLTFVVNWSVDIFIFGVTFTVVTVIYLFASNSVVIFFFDILTNYEYNLRSYLISIKLSMESKMFIFSSVFEKFSEAFYLITSNFKDYLKNFKLSSSIDSKLNIKAKKTFKFYII